jgi:hypothetical protein
MDTATLELMDVGGAEIVKAKTRSPRRGLRAGPGRLTGKLSGDAAPLSLPRPSLTSPRLLGVLRVLPLRYPIFILAGDTELI